MSAYLDINRRVYGPAGEMDQLVLSHVIVREIHVPAAKADDIDLGTNLDWRFQHQNTKRTGGGFLSMNDLGSQIWKDASPQAQADNGSAWTRRLRGLPNRTGQAWYPALLWEVEGGARRTDDGTLHNRRGVWRVPLVNEAVKINVPQSGDRAATTGWTPDNAWEQAAAALVAARLARIAEEAVTEQVGDRKITAAARRSLLAAQIMAVAADRREAIEAEIRAYLKSAREDQETATDGSVAVESWYKAGDTRDLSDTRSCAGGDTDDRVGEFSDPGIGEFSDPGIGEFSDPGIGEFSDPGIGEFSDDAFGFALGLASGLASGPTSAAAAAAAATAFVHDADDDADDKSKSVQSHTEDVPDVFTGHRTHYDDLAADASQPAVSKIKSGLNSEVSGRADDSAGEAGAVVWTAEDEQPVVDALAAAGIDVPAASENRDALAAVRAVGLGPEETTQQMLTMLAREPSLRRWLTNGHVCHLLHDIATQDWVTDTHRASGLPRGSAALDVWFDRQVS